MSDPWLARPGQAQTAQLPGESQAPLEIDSVVKRFGELTAVDGVSLRVAAGTCLGLLGPNGAGKTTLVRAIAGRVRLNAGTIRVFGKLADSAAARAEIGWVPQELALYRLLTCRENLHAFGSYQGLRGAPLRDSIQWCLEWGGLADLADTIVKNLSGGMRRRLNMAAGLVHRPRLVLLDEPTVGVDPQSRNRIFDMVAALRDQGATVVYTTHYMEEAERLCDRIAIIDGGRVISLGSSQELVARCFGGRSDVLMRFAPAVRNAGEWAAARGGTVDQGVAHFSVDQPTAIGPLLEAAARDGLDVVDVTLRRPNLESVFLQLTGRDLRQ